MQNSRSNNPATILTFSAMDPSGCGGIQADIETAASLGCHCAPIITTICSSGDQPSTESFAVDETIIIEQARSILDEMNVAVVKLGFLGSAKIIEAVHSLLNEFSHIPVVAHPALCLYDPENVDHKNILDAFATLILPASDLLILSLHEARKLAPESDSLNANVQWILNRDCQSVLVTGTGKKQQQFQNSFFGQRGLLHEYSWEQEAPTCHGSSSTLTMSTAAYVAHGLNVENAIENAQNFTWQAMNASRDLGFAKRTPHRFFWTEKQLLNTSSLPVKNTQH